MKGFNLKTEAARIKKEMISNGTMGRIDARKAKHEAKAIELGFANAQQAFNALGKIFLATANQ